MLKERLYFAVFFCGASVMVLELSGSRLLAPFLGTSVYVWTSLIGTVLSFLTLGYYWGGWLADRSPSFSLLSRIVLAASLTTALLALLNTPVLLKIYQLDLDLRLGAVLASGLLFGAPSVLLGMVLPFALRLDIEQIANSGRTAGRIYALSTLGSISGTFLSGFYLLSYFGTQQVILIIAAVLLLAATIIDWRDKIWFKLLTLVFIVILHQMLGTISGRVAQAGIRDLDTDYYRVLVVDSKEEVSERRLRMLVTDPLGAQSSIYPDHPQLMPPRYLQFYDLAFFLRPDLENALLLGGGAYTYLNHFLAKAPQATIDSVEIDPGMTKIAKSHFGLSDHPRHKIIHADARIFLARNSKKYSVAFVDVFSSSPSVPFHLVTVEAIEQLYRSLDERGVVLINIISALEGENSEFLRGVYASYRQVFPYVYLFPTAFHQQGAQGQQQDQLKKPQNIVLLATKGRTAPVLTSTDSFYDELLHLRWQGKPLSGGQIFSDNFAPVERLLLPVILDMQAAI